MNVLLQGLCILPLSPSMHTLAENGVLINGVNLDPLYIEVLT